MNILIIYGTWEGQTAKISGRIAKLLRDKGFEVTDQLASNLPNDFDLTAFDAAIIGGSIHMGKHPAYLSKFVTQNRERLDKIPTAFFTVCMGIISQEEASRQEASGFNGNFIRETSWQPGLTATFAGAVKYTQYNFITRFIMKRISRREGGSTDTSRDHEYTDWKTVEQFANQFAEKLSVPQTA